VELPRLEPLYQQYKDQGLSVIAIEAKRDRDRAEKFVNDNELTYPTLETGEEDDDVVRNIFGIRSYPTSFLVNEEGKIIYVHVGFARGDEVKLEKEIKQLLAG
jgi:thiol-disulfide isomerase/thioredoxin